jgi:hypothetical protein
MMPRIKANYVPRPDSLAGRVCAFFKANPEEELSSSDIAQKWDVRPTGNVVTLLMPAIEYGLLKRSKQGQSSVFSAGTRLAQIDLPQHIPTATSSVWPSAHGTAAARAGASKLPPLDLDCLVIEKGVPVPELQHARSLRYAAKFEQMEVGDSMLVPKAYAKSVIQAAQAWGKKNGGRKFMVREITEEHSRVWRKA